MKLIIGIDPDLKKSGVAFLKDNIIELSTLNFFQLTNYILTVVKNAKKSKDDVLIVVEKGEDNKAVFNAKKATKNSKIRDKIAHAAKIGVSVGKNFAITELLIEFCRLNEITYKTYVPKSAKWNHPFVEKQFNIIGRTNQEERDALRCAILNK